MQWNIPAKTFLLGEYIALHQGPALLLGTMPCFQISAIEEKILRGIHPDSPAGKFYQQAGFSSGFEWFDPYQGIGGLGASSAQFTGLYLAFCAENNQTFNIDDMLKHYHRVAWNGKGLRPSGYDVISQSAERISFIDPSQKQLESIDWPFEQIDFILVHTGKKLATHEHLQQFSKPIPEQQLASIVHEAKAALLQADDSAFAESINHYQTILTSTGLTASHSQQLINELKESGNIEAIKGCGWPSGLSLIHI